MLFRKKRTVGLALSGGASRGLSYIGVFRALEENDIHVDYVAGCSAGALAGVFYASNFSSDKMYELMKSVSKSDIVTSKIPLIASKTSGLQEIIRKNMEYSDISELPIKFCAIATDMKKGKEMEFTYGDIAPIVAGSCAVPGVFSPVEYKDYHLSDGGLTNNFPADVLKKHNIDIVIGVDINSSRGQGTESTKTIDVIFSSLDILMKASVKEGYKFCDLVIKPDLKKFNKAKLDGMDEMIEIGYQATMAQMDTIKELIKYGKRKKKKGRSN